MLPPSGVDDASYEFMPAMGVVLYQ